MLTRKPIFPGIIELNFQAGEVLGCNVYLIYDCDEWLLIDIGYEDTVEDFVEIIRQLDFPLSQCKTLVATHADVDHIQGLAKLKQILKTTVTAHPNAVKPLESGDTLVTLAEIEAQNLKLEMPPVTIEHQVNDGDVIKVGGIELEVWHTPGHTDSQLAFRVGDVLLSGDNIYRDGCIGAIDAHHGSDIKAFVGSLERIRDSDVHWLAPSHGPMFRNDKAFMNKTIDRVRGYLEMADFGTLAERWPLMDQWDDEVASGTLPEGLQLPS
ncbi:putative polyketide biosynthesis zinc-dependent hydrolase BaeB [Rubripirellula obstinata]|uniref:Putative polyketide biosynthesis zinc-dependent hydrolase BaeB n=1 Tax=Rubripirellula obstinata TaxID=406547 RepID=A0A5B1CIN4_9BACT|nr:MBL fold metallo-hydrolase [Rubripirellula obstinata]KAA1259470.1 putative polyketide biosynthesis zinc-dependent hydrolase BaeB [Rubripirellula obstinata]